MWSFVYGRDMPATARLRAELAEAHWSFMDSCAVGVSAGAPRPGMDPPGRG